MLKLGQKKKKGEKEEQRLDDGEKLRLEGERRLDGEIRYPENTTHRTDVGPPSNIVPTLSRYVVFTCLLGMKVSSATDMIGGGGGGILIHPARGRRQKDL